MGFAEELEKIQAETEMREQRMVMLQLRKFLATALCCQCGEPLGDGKIIQDDNDRTIHAECEEIEP